MKLRGLMITLITLCALIIGHQARGQALQPAVQPTDPASVYRAEYEAQNAGDTSASRFAEDVVSIPLPTVPGADPVFIGKAALQKITEEVVAAHAYVDLRDFQVNGDMITFRSFVTADFFRDLGVTEPLEHSGVAVVRNGLIQFEAWVMTEESQAKLAAAMAHQTNKSALDRLYTEVINQKNLDIIDELYADAMVEHATQANDAQTAKRNLSDLLTGFPDLQATTNHWISEGDLITVQATFTGTQQGTWAGLAATRKAVSWTQIDIYRLDNGKIAEIWRTIPTADILQQLGYQLVPPAQ